MRALSTSVRYNVERKNGFKKSSVEAENRRRIKSQVIKGNIVSQRILSSGDWEAGFPILWGLGDKALAYI